ncbi:hypothetical protein MFIFM68171_10098 [Madurella fahalii]|uniref:Uncharacterized protein n=1 Tax=Madurella fahalii TaxID=1157608 RepID=A0ABQ0GQ62_9PEZI
MLLPALQPSDVGKNLRKNAQPEREERAKKEWRNFGGLNRIENPEACPEEETGLGILQDFWCLLLDCPEPEVPSLGELEALLQLHSTIERFIADFVLRATSDHLPEALHDRPALLPMAKTRKVMTQLSLAEKARLHRAFYREEFLNWFFSSQEPKVGSIDEVNLVKAWCISVTWPPWETQEIMATHAYAKHQYELVHEAINVDFIRQLEARMVPEGQIADRLNGKSGPESTDHGESRPRSIRQQGPEYEGFIVVEPRVDDNIAVDSYIERSVGLGFGYLRHVLSRDDRGRRRLTQTNFHALSRSNSMSYHGPTLHWSLNSVTRFQDQAGIFPEARSGRPVDQPGPGWTLYLGEGLREFEIVLERHYLFLTGLVFWDAERLNSMHPSVCKGAGEWAAEVLGFYGPPNRSDIWPRGRGWWLYMDEDAKRPKSGACWFFTTPPTRALLVDPMDSLQELEDDFKYDMGNGFKPTEEKVLYED